MKKSREELVHLILQKSKSVDTLLIMAISETEQLVEIYNGLYKK